MNGYLDEKSQPGGPLECFKKHLGITGEVSTDHGYQRTGLPAPEGWTITVPPTRQKFPPIRRPKSSTNGVTTPSQLELVR